MIEKRLAALAVYAAACLFAGNAAKIVASMVTDRSGAQMAGVITFVVLFAVGAAAFISANPIQADED